MVKPREEIVRGIVTYYHPTRKKGEPASSTPFTVIFTEDKIGWLTVVVRIAGRMKPASIPWKWSELPKEKQAKKLSRQFARLFAPELLPPGSKFVNVHDNPADA